MVFKLVRSLLLICILALSAGCVVRRPALTKEGRPDSDKRMSITCWALDQERPREALVISFAYPDMTSFFHTRVLHVGKTLHQYRLDKIESRGGRARVFLTDLDTGKPAVLTRKL